MQESKSVHLSVSDVRSLVKLVGECRDLGDDAQAWRSHWLRRTAQLIGADLLTGGEVALEPGGHLRSAGFAGCWNGGVDLPVLFAALPEAQRDLTFSPVFRNYFSNPLQVDGTCQARSALVSDDAWEPSAYYQQLHRTLGVEHTLICFVPSTRVVNEFSGMTVYREKATRRDFSRRDQVLVRELTRALADLVGGPLTRFDAPSPGDLAPRVRPVLQCLLEGDSDKQIAARLNISRYTVNEYMKIIFRHFGVQSRSEMMARWIRRIRPRG